MGLASVRLTFVVLVLSAWMVTSVPAQSAAAVKPAPPEPPAEPSTQFAKPAPPLLRMPDGHAEQTAAMTETHALLLPLIQGVSTTSADEPTRDHDTPEADSDGDGLINSVEAALATNPHSADSDCDYVSDLEEVGSAEAPIDSDGDALIDALESRILDSNGNAVSDEEDNSVAIQLTCANFAPFAITADGEETTRLEVRLHAQANTAQVTALISVNGYPLPKLDGEALAINDEIALFDDGTHGDRLSGDGIWSRGGFSVEANNLSPSFAYAFRLRHFEVTQQGVTSTVDLVATGPGSTFSQVPLFILHPDAVTQPTILSRSLQHVPHLINIVDPELALSLKRKGGTTEEMAQRFYTTFGDEYDFLFFFPDAYAVNAPYGSHRTLQNAVHNIGKAIFNHSANYGSGGRLLGITFMNLGGGPTLHELMHQWAVSGLSDLGFNQCTDSAHWGFTGAGRGQLGGFDPATLVDNGDGTYTADSFGTFANGGDSVPYTPLEQYLAGFVAPSAVAPITLPVNVDCSSIDYGTRGKITFAAAGLQTLTIEAIMDHLGGVRLPDHTASQKVFNAAFVILSEQPLNASEMAAIELEAKHLSGQTESSLYSFTEATNGQAILDTRIRLPLTLLSQ